MRVLVVSHSWEALDQGGAERSAAAMVAAYNAVPGVEATLAACVPSGQLIGNAPLGVDESTGTILVDSQTDGDFLSWNAPATAAVWQELLAYVQPDVMHLHHYAQIGIELPLVARRLRPGMPVVMTLHEFMAMCPRSGQMLTVANQLCQRPSVRGCSACMGWAHDYTAARENYLRLGLDSVDHFTSPSAFLAGRYLEWGIPESRLTVVPNVVEIERREPRPARRTSGSLRVVYLGQHTPFKGIDVLLDAYAQLPGHVRRAIHLDVYGGGAERFGEGFESALEQHSARGLPQVSFRGKYPNSQVAAILDEADLLVMPSVWWENSPVVIEEALARGVPVLCSDIGGMAEKVRPGLDGWHFGAGSPASLARALTGLVDQPELFDSLALRTPPTPAETAGRYLDLYQQLRATLAATHVARA